MSNLAQRLATDLRNAYEGHDREAFERHLARMTAALEYTGPTPAPGSRVPVVDIDSLVQLAKSSPPPPLCEVNPFPTTNDERLEGPKC
jgi:hypothetical protein